MKNLFGMYKQEKMNNFNKFIVKRISAEKEKALEALQKENDSLRRAKNPPQWIVAFSFLLFMFGLIFVIAMLFAKDGFTNALQTRGYFFYLGIGFAVVGAGLYIFYCMKIKKSNADPQMIEFVEKANNFLNECSLELEIPETAEEMDIIFSLVKLNKKGKEKLRQSSLLQYVNLPLKVFADQHHLYFADSIMVIAIPLSSITAIEKINKRMPLPQWNKEASFKSEKYKKFKIYTNQNGLIWTKPYYSIKANIDNEPYFFLLPCYEIENFVFIMKEAGINIDIEQ